MHTDLLDSEPYSAVDSVCFNSTLFRSSMLTADGFRPLMADDSIHRVDRRDSETNTFVLRNSQLGVSYAEMVHPVDFDAAEIDLRGAERGDFCVRSFLFPERLEKGVIRRGRICGWFMPAENDLQSAVELARQFVDEPLPLTT